MILTELLTVALLPLVLVMVWRCWNLAPAPAIRWWALSFAGMSAAVLAQAWRAEVWRYRCYKLEQLQKRPPSQSRPRQLSVPKSKLSSQFQRFLDAEARFVSTLVETDTAADIAVIVGWSQKTGGQSILHIQLPSGLAFSEVCSAASRVSCPESHRNQAWRDFSELRSGNREPILIASWPSETLIKRLWMRSRQRPILSQSKAKRFWNPKSLNASYARLENGSNPSLKPFGKQSVKKAGEVPFALLSSINILLCEGDGICGLALWLPTSAFTFSASHFHLKKYVFFLFACFCQRAPCNF